MSKERLQSQPSSLDNIPFMSIGFGSEHEMGEAVLVPGSRLLELHLLAVVYGTGVVNLPCCRP